MDMDYFIHRKCGFVLCWVVVLAACGAFGDFSFSNFATTTRFAFDGVAIPANDRLQIIQDGTISTAGAVWCTSHQDAGAGFETTFQYKLTYSSTPADGFAFVIQNAAAGTSTIGGGGGSLGYGGIPNSLAVEFDNYQNTGEPGVHVAVHSNGTAPNDAAHTSAAMLGSATITMDQNTHTVKIKYAVSPATIQVFQDNMTTPVLTVNYDVSSIGLYQGVNNPYVSSPSHWVGVPINNHNVEVRWAGAQAIGAGAYVGFTGGTGGLAETVEILSWSYTATPPSPAPQVTGYSYVFDNTSNTVPDTTEDVPHTTDPHSEVFAAALDGSFYFHLRASDNNGNWSSATHLGPLVVSVTGQTLPLASPMALSLLAAVIGLAGARSLRRRR
jgi:hypothetical protein